MSKIADIFSTLVIFVSIGLLIIWLSFDLEEEYSGFITVIDGDTVIIDQEKIRLEGIDAPELRQECTKNGESYQCGQISREYLKSLARRGQMLCKAWQRDKYERLLGRCHVGQIDINGQMVRDGWAVAFGNYYAQEKQAREAGSGIWSGDFDRPREWRITHGSIE